MSRETAGTFAFDNEANQSGIEAGSYISPVIITGPLDIARQTLGTDMEGERDGYGAKWDVYSMPASHQDEGDQRQG